jgi:nucleoside-diphosphate-sugar epimerase
VSGTLAITGGTGFVGKRLIEQALAAGYRVRALTRRVQAPRDGVVWITGALDNATALANLAAGADVVIHVAGVVNAPDRAEFVTGNITGTQAIVDATRAAGIVRFVHVSSLAAREPQLSVYGWSKHGAEEVVAASGLDWTMVRPSGVFGPGDKDWLDMFRAAKVGLALLPPPGKIAVIHVDDLVRLLIALVATNPGRVILEADDGKPGGWTHREFARAIGTAVGRKVLALDLPKPVMLAAARVDRLLRGDKAKLTADRVGYFCHPDWTIDPARAPDPALWRAQIPTPEGLAATAAWYREHSLL